RHSWGRDDGTDGDAARGPGNRAGARAPALAAPGGVAGGQPRPDLFRRHLRYRRRDRARGRPARHRPARGCPGFVCPPRAPGPGGAIAVVARPLRGHPDDRRVARFIEERFPDCGDAIVTAADVAERPREGRDFAPLVVAAAARTLRTLDLDAVVDRAEARRAA